MNRFNSSLTFGLTLLISSALTFAKDDDKKMDRDPHKMADKMAEKITKELKLNDDQAAKVRAVFEDGADQMMEMRKDQPQGKEMHDGMMKQMSADKVDTAAMNKQFNERMAKMQERHAIMQKHFVELHDILTPDQRAKLAAFMEKRHDEMMKKWKDHGKDGMGKGMMNDGDDK